MGGVRRSGGCPARHATDLGGFGYRPVMAEDQGADAQYLGVDIGGSGVKGAPVDLLRGRLVGERKRIPTPQPATPSAVAGVVADIAKHFDWAGPIGVTYPGVVRHGVARTAANVDDGWIGTDVRDLIERRSGSTVTVINDADAAGLAELEFGAARDHAGVVMLLTIGTGIGSALLVNGALVPNTEFGHLEIRGRSAESRASDLVRETKNLSWEDWAERFNEVLVAFEGWFWPDLFVLGGGASKRFDKFGHLLDTRTPVVPAELRNEAGIVGAALAAARAEAPAAVAR